MGADGGEGFLEVMLSQASKVKWELARKMGEGSSQSVASIVRAWSVLGNRMFCVGWQARERG